MMLGAALLVGTVCEAVNELNQECVAAQQRNGANASLIEQTEWCCSRIVEPPLA
jgi:hypothetical protein